MKKMITMTCLLLLMTGTAHSQSRNEKLRRVSGKWELTTEQKVAFREIFQFPDKSEDELFRLTELYFQHNFIESPVTESDKENGSIKARLAFPSVYFRNRDAVVQAEMLVQFKENRVRMSVILLSYEVTQYPVSNPEYGTTLRTRSYTSNPIDTYPVKPDAKDKSFSLNVFYHTYLNAMNQMDRLRESLYSGITRPSGREGAVTEGDDW